jgi:hypothetical protein
MADEGSDRSRAAVLAAHYQHVSEMSHRIWEERNRKFLHLIAVVALAVLLTYDAQTLMRITLDAAAERYSLKLPPHVEQSLPYVVLHGLLWAFVFYLMTDVYRLTATIMSNTNYRKGVEHDLRGELRLIDDHYSYSFESGYQTWKPSRLKPVVGWFYVTLLGAMLVLFIVFRITSDWPASGISWPPGSSWRDVLRQHFLLIADVVLGSATLLMFLGYAKVSLWPKPFEPGNQKFPQP